MGHEDERPPGGRRGDRPFDLGGVSGGGAALSRRLYLAQLSNIGHRRRTDPEIGEGWRAFAVWHAFAIGLEETHDRK